MVQVITAREAVLADGVLPQPALVMEDGVVAEIFSRDAKALPAGAPEIAFPHCILSPAFCDVHIHGSAGHDVMQDSSTGRQAMAAFLAVRGTSEFLATTVTAPVDDTLRALERIADWIERASEKGTARAVGIHLEGPFVSHARRGVHPPECIQPPSVALFGRFQEAARGHIRLLTLATEEPGGEELLRHAVADGVRVSLGHSDATYAQAKAAIGLGAASATHTFNAMRPMEHREPGLTGAVLTEDSLYAEAIADGHHVAPAVMKLWARAKPADRRILVTDAIAATGQPDGSYKLGSLNVTVRNGRAEHDGKLAGSVLTLDRGIANLASAADVPLQEAAQAAGLNPRALLGLPAPLEKGSPANFCLIGQEGLAGVWMDGVRL